MQGLKFEVIPSTFEENLKEEDFDHPRDYVIATAAGKAKEVKHYCKSGNNVTILCEYLWSLSSGTKLVYRGLVPSQSYVIVFKLYIMRCVIVCASGTGSLRGPRTVPLAHNRVRHLRHSKRQNIRQTKG